MGAIVIRQRPAAPREVFATRIEPELREALDREAEKRGVSRSAIVRDALIRVVDRRVLEEAADRERLAAFRRGMEADAARLRAALGNEGERHPVPA
jgi:predicted transcriptional regulator